MAGNPLLANDPEAVRMTLWLQDFLPRLKSGIRLYQKCAFLTVVAGFRPLNRGYLLRGEMKPDQKCENKAEEYTTQKAGLEIFVLTKSGILSCFDISQISLTVPTPRCSCNNALFAERAFFSLIDYCHSKISSKLAAIFNQNIVRKIRISRGIPQQQTS